MADAEILNITAGLVYCEQAQPGQISQEQAIELGEMLLLSGFKQMYGYALMNPNSQMTVKDMVNRLDREEGIPGTLEQKLSDGRSIVGPYFRVSGDGEAYCLTGIAIWESVV